MSSQVTVSKGLLAGLAGVAALAVLGFVFLLGRSSVGPVPVQTLVVPAPAAAVPAAPQPAQPGAPVEPAPPPPAVAALPPRPPAPTAPQSPAVPPADPQRAAVAAYFQAVDRIQPQRQGDPEAVAQQVMAGFGKGDTSDFEGMIQEAQTTRDRLAAITPPPPCAAYHRESLAILDGGLDLTRAIKAALGGTNPPADLTDKATALKTRSEALQAQEQELKRRYVQ